MTGTVNTPVKYPIDVTGVHPDNRIENEIHRVSPIDRVITPKMIKFYAESLNVRTPSKELKLGKDYKIEDMDPVLTSQTGKAIMQSIVLTDNTIIGEIIITYQCYGTGDLFTREYLGDLIDIAHRKQDVYWKDIQGLPVGFNPSPHRHDIEHTSGWEGAIQVMDELVMLVNQLKTTRDHKLYSLVEDFKRDVIQRLERNMNEVQDARSAIGSIGQLEKRIKQILAELKNQVDTLTDSSEFLAKMKALEDKLQKEINRVSREQTAELNQANKNINKSIADLIEEVNTKLSLSNYRDEIKNYVLTTELDHRLTSYVPVSHYNNNEKANRKYIDDNLALKIDTTEAKKQIESAKRSIDYGWLLNIPETIVHQRYIERQNIDHITSHGNLSIRSPSGTLPSGIDTSKGVYLSTQATNDTELKAIQILTDGQGRQWRRVHRSGRYQDWIGLFGYQTTQQSNDLNHLSPGIHELDKSKREWDGIVGTLPGTNQQSFDATVLDYSTLKSKQQLVSLGYGYHYLRTNDDPTGANAWSSEMLVTSRSIDLLYPGLSGLKGVVDGLSDRINQISGQGGGSLTELSQRITNNTNEINTLKQKGGSGPEFANGSITLYHQEGRGAYNQQYATKAPVYIETRGSVARDTYHPFIKGKVRDNGSFGTIFTLGYTSRQEEGDGFGRGVIMLQEDNGHESGWYFEHSGCFVTPRLNVGWKGEFVADGDWLKFHGNLKANDLMVTSDIRKKENIKKIKNPLEKLDQLNGYTFDFKEDGRPSVGVIAQEVEAIYPELVDGEESKSVNYNGLIGLLVESVKALREENDLLKERLDKLESQDG